jgi:hypothetical protein
MRLFHLPLAVLTAVTAVLALAGPAQADLVEDLVSGDCTDQVLERPFTRFLDPASYVLAPNGTFEAGAAEWTLNGGAHVAAGNEPFLVHGPGETRSLRLPAGSSATSSPVCIGLGHPTLRLFARNDGSLLSRLDAEVVFAGPGGEETSLPLLPVTGAPGTWAPTLPTPLVVNLATPLSDSFRKVAVRFSVPAGAGDWTIDDVYVDPYRK